MVSACDRADLSADATAIAALRVDVARPAAQRGHEAARLSLQGGQGGAREHRNLRMAFAGEGRAGGRLARERHAEPTRVGGKGMVKEEESAADVRRAVHQRHLGAPLGHVMRRSHPCQSGAHDEHGPSPCVAGPHSTASIMARTCSVVIFRTVVALFRHTTAQAPQPWQRAAFTVATFLHGCSSRAS